MNPEAIAMDAGAATARAATETATYLLAFLPPYLSDEGTGWDLYETDSFDAYGFGSQYIDGPRGDRDADQGELASWCAEHLGYPVTLVADTTRIGWPNDRDETTGDLIARQWNDEPIYHVRPVGPAEPGLER